MLDDGTVVVAVGLYVLLFFAFTCEAVTSFPLRTPTRKGLTHMAPEMAQAQNVSRALVKVPCRDRGQKTQRRNFCILK